MDLFLPQAAAAGPFDGQRIASFPGKPALGAFTIVEIAIAVAVIGLLAASAFTTLATLNKSASSTRIMTNARAIVQRNVESAQGATLKATSVPVILAFASNAVWDDDGGGDNLVTIYASRDGTPQVKGTLLRTVTAEPNSLGLDLRRVTFHLNYSISGRALSYEMTTIRAMDKG